MSLDRRATPEAEGFGLEEVPEVAAPVLAGGRPPFLDIASNSFIRFTIIAHNFGSLTVISGGG